LLTVILALSCSSILYAQAPKQYVIKFAHVDPADIYTSKKQAQAVAFKTVAETRSGGRLKVEVYPAGQLGSEAQVLELTRNGIIQMTSTADGAITGHFKEIMVLGIPYLFKSESIAWKVFDGPFGRELAEGIRKNTGLRVLGYGETGFRSFTNSSRPIKSPDDIKGLKFRVMDNPAHIEMVKALGGYPTPMDWKEVYVGLQMRVIDGQENPISVIVYGKLFEVQKYMTLDGHLYSVDFIFINDGFYNSLPKDLQDILREAATVAGTVSRGIQQLTSATGLELVKSKGMEIYSPSHEELEKLKRTAQGPVMEMVRKQVGKEWIDKLSKAIADAEASESK
jgi:tripartite ATP-independent transporter DctP family solute receptor